MGTILVSKGLFRRLICDLTDMRFANKEKFIKIGITGKHLNWVKYKFTREGGMVFSLNSNNEFFLN